MRTAAIRRSALSEGGFREFILLFSPLLLINFSTCLYFFVEKLLLARFSVEAMEAAVNAAYACQLIQGPCVVITMLAQVYVGRWCGAQDWKSIGPGLWQFIWFSFLSMLITLPFSFVYGRWYFQGTAIEEIVMPYYYFLILINFLYPLASALSCFFIGQGKTRLVLFSSLGAQFIKMLLAYLLIFGWSDWIPSLGIMGGAISTLIAQGLFCLLLLGVFLNRKHAAMYCSRFWGLRPKLFWECIQPGILRALNRILSMASWASIAHLMTAKGGDYLLILSIGGTLFFFLPFLGDAICQAQTTVVSQILGAHNYHSLNKAFRSGTLLVLAIVFLVAIPLLLYSQPTFYYLFPTVTMSDVMISRVFLGIWVSFACFTFAYLPISYILAYKDMKFSLIMGLVTWINGYLLMYFAIEIMNIAADQFWLVLSLMHGSTALLYYWRMKWLQSKEPVLQKV